MLKFETKKLFAMILAVLLWVGMTGFDVWADKAGQPSKILLTPFQILAGDDLSYLQRGIEEMLATRLAWEGKVTVVRSATPTPVSQGDALALAGQMGADYVLLGSLTALGGRVSTDARVLSAATQKQVLSFSRSGAQQSDVIDHIDQLAADINTRLFGRGAPSRLAPAEVPKAAAQAPQERPSIYQHPEKLLTTGAAEGDRRYDESSDNAALAPLRLRSRKQAGQIVGVTAGDVDGDGRTEIITATTSGDLLVQRIDQGRWIKIARVDGIGHYIGVDAADVNGNGKAEIFVTNFDNQSSRLDSFVLEWDGKSLQRTADRLNWYFRAVDLPERGRVLVGQRQGVADRFGAGIYEIVWQGGAYDGTNRLPLPRDLNVFGFGYGRLRADENEEIAAYNPDGYVRILKRNGDEEWITSERYGGSAAYVQFPNKMDAIEKENVYLNPRLLLYDLDGDGLQEMLVVGNESASVLKNVRLFKKGRLEWLKWDSLGMRTVLRTQTLPKFIADFALTDLDGDGRPEMVVAIVQKESGMLSKGASYLAVFDIVAPPKKEN